MSELVVAPTSAIADSVLFELAGQSLASTQLRVAELSAEISGMSVSRFSTTDALPADLSRWSSQLIAKKLPEKVADVFLAHPDAAGVLAIDAARLTVVDAGWLVDDMIAIDRDYHGVPVISAGTSEVVGILSMGKNGCVIVGP